MINLWSLDLPLTRVWHRGLSAPPSAPSETVYLLHHLIHALSVFGDIEQAKEAGPFHQVVQLISFPFFWFQGLSIYYYFISDNSIIMYLHVISKEKGRYPKLHGLLVWKNNHVHCFRCKSCTHCTSLALRRQISDDALAVADEIGCKRKAQNRDELARLHHNDRSSHFPAELKTSTGSVAPHAWPRRLKAHVWEEMSHAYLLARCSVPGSRFG